MLLNNENFVVYVESLNSQLGSNSYLTYGMTLPYPSSGNAYEYLSDGYQILWQFEYDGNTYQNIYVISGIGGC